MARLRILSDGDFDKLYKIPKLNDDERQCIFELDEIDQNYLNTVNNIPAKINYILHLGYFRISGYFFSFTFPLVKEDVIFIIKTYFSGSSFPMKQISNRQYYANRRAILNKHKMSLYSRGLENNLLVSLKSLVKQHAVPKYLFDSLLDCCHQHKIIRPSYSILQDLISEALNKEKLRIGNKLYTIMDNSLRNSLSHLLKKDDLFYQITIVKKDQKDFTTNEIKSSVEKNKLLFEIYHSAVKIIKQLDISEQNVAHYAELAGKYTVYGLRNLKQTNMARLYLLCYVYYRFLKINDHLVSSFIHKVNDFIDDADTYQKEAIYLAQVTDKENRDLAASILSLHINKKILDNQLREKSFAIVPKYKFQQFIQKLRKPHLTPDYYRWQYYDKNAPAIKLNIRLTFKVLDFQTKSEDLSKAIAFLKTHFDNHKSFSDYKFEEIPLEFISPSLKRYVIIKTKSRNGKKKVEAINADCYEFMLYSYIEKHLGKGTVTIKDSLSYRSLDDELLQKEDWDKNKVTILQSLENQLISTDIEKILNNFESLMSNRYREVNQRISSGINDKIKIKYNKKGEVVRWRLPYKKVDDGVNNPFYENMNISSIGQIIKFTNHHTDFIKEFTHTLPTYSKTQAEEAVISACLVAKGTGNDIYKMKDISDVEIAAVSGDMHSVNRVNFALLYMFGYRFMPRFTKLDQKVRNYIVSFDAPDLSKYKGYLIKPNKKTNKSLIIKEWDNILRILATLGLKKNTQSSIVRKLSSYKSNDTLKAFIELDKIIMTLYVLDYIDDQEMRKCVDRSLNRAESYHQLRAAIAKVSGRKLIGKNEIELIINNECARLLAICIIFYNASLLSGIYEHYRSLGMLEECEKVIRLSPVAWLHISLIGKYEFKGNIILLDLQGVIAHLVSNLKIYI